MWAGRKDPRDHGWTNLVVSSPGLSWEMFRHWKVWPKVWHSMAPLRVLVDWSQGEKGNDRRGQCLSWT